MKRSAFVFVLLVAFLVAALLLHRRHQSQSSSPQPATPAPAAQSSVAASAPSAAEPVPAPVPQPEAPQDCWIDHTLSSSSTAADRQEYGKKWAAQLGLLNFMVKVDGDDSQYLLIGAIPDQRAKLLDLAKDMKQSDPFTTTTCVKGFSKVDFIVIDQDLNQTEVDAFYTDTKRAGRFLYQLQKKKIANQ